MNADTQAVYRATPDWLSRLSYCHLSPQNMCTHLSYLGGGTPQPGPLVIDRGSNALPSWPLGPIAAQPSKSCSEFHLENFPEIPHSCRLAELIIPSWVILPGLAHSSSSSSSFSEAHVFIRMHRYVILFICLSLLLLECEIFEVSYLLSYIFTPQSQHHSWHMVDVELMFHFGF